MRSAGFTSVGKLLMERRSIPVRQGACAALKDKEIQNKQLLLLSINAVAILKYAQQECRHNSEG